MRSRPAVVVITSASVLAAVAFGGTAATASQPKAVTRRAVVTGAASRGGRVIVTLRQQFPQLKIEAQGAQRTSATRSSQNAVVSSIAAHGGSYVRRLVSVNAVAARVPAAEVARLRSNPAVASIQRDSVVEAPATAEVPPANISQRVCPNNPADPLIEPEALSLTHFKSQPAAADDADTIATGKGVKVGLTGIDALAGNPNFIRPDGQHVVIDSPTPNADDSDFDGGGDEWYGDTSAIAGQGTVTYDFSKELPYSHLPSGCTFKIEGIAPDVSLVDTGYFGQGSSSSTTPEYESQAIAGLDHAAIDDGVSVVSESYGYGAIPGQTDYSAINEANDELVAAGITVVESAGDSGVGGTVEVPANDPNVIDAGATTSFRLLAQAWGYRGWENNQMAPLSSSGTTPNNNIVDLVAPGLGGEASCSPSSATCPQTTLTEAFGGTSQSAPFIAGAAADVIQAYSDSHGGAKPTPATVKQILTGTARDIGAIAGQQGSGLLDVYAAVRAAQQEPGSTVTSSSAALIPTPTQLDVAGKGGSIQTPSVSLYNASSTPTTVQGRVRSFTGPTQFGKVVTESVTAPPGGARPAEGVQAAKNISFAVPSDLSQFNVNMITPNSANDAVLSLLLFDPQGRLSEVSYDYSSGPNGPVSNNEQVTINDPMPGRWTAKIVWNNGRSHLQNPPPKPGKYRGTISVRATAQHAKFGPVTKPVTIAPHTSATVPVSIGLATRPGDASASVQFTGSNGSATSLPVSLRTVIPPSGGRFQAILGSSVARGFGPLKSFTVDVPPGKKNLEVDLSTADTSPDNIIDYFLVAPNGLDGYYDRTASTTPRGVGAQQASGHAALVVADPPPGVWTVQVMLDLTTSGKEFRQDVNGVVRYDTGNVRAYNVPDSAKSVEAMGSTTLLRIGVQNPTAIGRTFTVTSANKDITAPDVYIPAGATAIVTAELTPSAAVGTVVSGLLTVQSNGSALSPLLKANEFTFDPQSVAQVPYEYTVGPPRAESVVSTVEA